MSSARSSFTFLFSDIEGSTRRWAEDPGMAEVLSVHDELVRSVIADHSGRWVKHTGDGVLAVFADPAEAVLAAANMQERIVATQWPGESLRVRIGLHSGPAIESNGDVYGLAVSAAARVADAGHGGQVLVSDACALQVGSPPGGLAFVDVGRHRLKDLGEPWQLHQLAGPGLEDDFPPLRTLDAGDHNLPVQLTSFVGRERELSDLRALVGDHRLVTLTGVGGAGKTRLALQLAAEVIDRFRDGVRVVELAAVSDPDAVASAVETVLGIRYEDGSPSDPIDRIVEHLRHREMLLVVDNCEHVLDSAAPLIDAVLRGAPGTSFIASSREGLAVAGEHLWQVPSLTVTDDAGESEALQLFAARAAAVSPSFVVGDDNREAVVHICRMLDGVPLAIELAAARTRVLGPDQIAERLQDRFRLLTGGSRSAMPRHQTLEATVAWSYQLLDEPERRLFERLSVFRGGFTLEAVEGVCADDTIETYDVLDLLTGLVDKSMVTTTHTEDGSARFGMLETLRQYAQRVSTDHGDTAVWKDRHASWFAGWVGDLSAITDLRGATVPIVAPEAENLAVALDWCDTHAMSAIIAEALARHRYSALGDLEGAVSIARRGLAAQEIGAARRAHLLLIVGRALATLGNIEDGEAAIVEAFEALDAVVDPTAMVCLLLRLSNTYNTVFDPAVGVELADRAVAVAQPLSSDLRALASHTAAWARIWRSADPEEVLATGETAVTHARTFGDPSLEMEVTDAVLLSSMALDYRDGGDRTTEVEDRMLRLADPETGFGWGFEWLAIRRCDWDIATRALDAQHTTGRWRISKLVARGTMQWMRGSLEAAVATFADARVIGSPGRWHHDLYPAWAEATCLLGDLDGVRRLADEHVDLETRDGEESMRLGTFRALVQAEIDAGNVDRAEGLVHQMRRTLAEHPLQMGAPVQLSTPEGYLALAEAELTRLTGPDPEAWARARRMNVWEYWRTYADARRVEASVARDADAEELRSSVLERARELDLDWIVEFLGRPD